MLNEGDEEVCCS